MTATTVDDLQVERYDLTQRHESALEHLHVEREARSTVAGRRVLGEADEEELGSANKAVRDAEEVAESLASAVSLITTRLADAEEAARQEQRDALREQAGTAAKARQNAEKRLRNALGSARAAFEAYDAASSESAAVRSALIDMRDLDGEEQRIKAKYAARFEELRRTAPTGMEVNTDTLARKEDAEINELRATAAREAEEAAPNADTSALEALATDYADVTARIIDPSTRTAIAAGLEFIRAPETVSPVFGVVAQTSRRVYGSHEADEAHRRYDDLRAALSRLSAGTRVDAIGADINRSRGTQVQAA